MRFHRQSAVLNDAIEALDHRLHEARNDISEAFSRLTKEELTFVAGEIDECIQSRVYFLENYLIIQTEAGILMGMAPLWSHQWQVEEAVQREVSTTGQARVIVLKPRQAGITEYANGVMCWRTFFVPGAYNVSVAQAPDVAAHIHRKVMIAHSSLPWWMKAEIKYRTKGEYIEFGRDHDTKQGDPGLGSVFITTHSQRATGIAIGRTVRNLHMCLTAANIVIDEHGYHKSIAEIRVGDAVRTPTGIAKVTAFSHKPASSIYEGAEEGYVITPWCGAAFPVEGTGNHRIKCVKLNRANVIEKRKLRPGESAKKTIVVESGMKELRDVDLDDKVSYPVRPIASKPIDRSIFCAVQTGHERKQKGGYVSNWTPPEPSREFGFAIGLYIAEGCISKGRRDIIICLDEDEDEMADRFAAAVGVIGSRRTRDGSRSVQHHFYVAALTDWFRTHVGAKDDKHIPQWAWSYGRDFLLGIVEGMILGDGHIHPKYHTIQFTSTRPHLAVEIRDAACSLGFGWSGLYRAEAGVRYGRNCQTRYDVIFGKTPSIAMRQEYEWGSPSTVSQKEAAHWRYSADKTEVYVSIRKLERVKLGLVYDIEVDSSDHEFLLPCAWTHNSEVSRWASGEAFTADIEPSMNAPDTIAICESTALGTEGFFANMWNEAADGESDWTPVFLPAYKAPKFSLPLKPNQHPFILTATELAMKERVLEEEQFEIKNEFFNWRRRRIKSSIKRTGYPYAHQESYPCSPKEAFQSSGFNVFPRHKLDEQQEACVRRPKLIGEIIYQGMNARPKLILTPTVPGQSLEKRELENRFYVWEEYQANESYYAASDVGDGILGGDFSVTQVMRAGRGASPDVQVAEWVGYAQPVEFAKITYAIGIMYGKAEIAVEYAREGVTTANHLANDLEYPNLYRPRSRDRIGRQLANYLHWQTTMKTKVLLKSTMSETLLENGVVIRSQYLLDEMYKMVRIGSSWGALTGHDDAGIAICICLFCLRETMAELRAPQTNDDASNTTPSSSARITGGGINYGIYDRFFRLIGQTRDMAKALEIINANPGLQIKPIVVSKANTAYSPIFHGRGSENQMLREGADSRDILPTTLQAWKSAQPPMGGDAEGFNAALSGEDMWGMQD